MAAGIRKEWMMEPFQRKTQDEVNVGIRAESISQGRMGNSH